MASIFGSLKKYAGKYTLKSESHLDSEDLQIVKPYGDVVASTYGQGMSVCFYTLVGNFKEYVPVSINDTKLKIGDRVMVTDIIIETLEKDGKEIFRAKKA